MTITFTQAGQVLTLTSKPPVQYSDNVPVTVTLDSEYSSATEIVLLTQPPSRGHPARTLLTRSGSTATGAISRAMLMNAGTTMFVLAGRTGDMYLPTAACMVDVQRAVDPQAQTYAHDPVSVEDIIANMVADYLQTDAGRAMMSEQLSALATDKGFTVPTLSSSVTSTSTTVGANSYAVKVAYDRANTALRRTIYTANNVVFPSAGYVKLADMSTLGLDKEKDYIVSVTVRGWHDGAGTLSIAKNNDGTTLYAFCSQAATFTSITLEIWYTKIVPY